MSLLRAAVLLLLVGATPASASPIDDAKAAIAKGDLDAAQEILAPILATKPEDLDAQFLNATIATLQERWPDAIVLYRRILDQHPDLLRVRLDYARALFEDHQDEEADYNFRLALPNVPEAVITGFFNFSGPSETLRSGFIAAMVMAISPSARRKAPACGHA